MTIIISDDIYLRADPDEKNKLVVCAIGASSSSSNRIMKTKYSGEILMHPEEVKLLYKKLGELLGEDYKTKGDKHRKLYKGYERDYIGEFLNRLCPNALAEYKSYVEKQDKQYKECIKKGYILEVYEDGKYKQNFARNTPFEIVSMMRLWQSEPDGKNKTFRILDKEYTEDEFIN